MRLPPTLVITIGALQHQLTPQYLKETRHCVPQHC